MADENTPAFYPRVGRNIAKNFRSAQPPASVEDPRAMDLPQYGDVDLSVPTKENLELGRRMAERDAQLRRQQQADRSIPEKLAGGLQAGRLMGSALAQSVASIPTAITKGGKAAEEFIAENMYKPTQPLAYEYAQDVGDFLEKLETQYKIPPILPEAVALQYLTGPATSQAMRTAGRGAEQAGRAIERRMEPVVKGALERGGLPREMAMAMGANTQSNVIKPKGGNWLTGSVENALSPLRPDMLSGQSAESVLKRMLETYTPEVLANASPGVRQNVMEGITHLERKVALNNWVDSNLTNYVKKEMGTADDPVRKLAEEGIVHIPSQNVGINRYKAPDHRQLHGGEQLGKSEEAKAWEDATDVAIKPAQIGYLQGGYREPWMDKASPDTKISHLSGVFDNQALGFDHIMDVLRQDLDAGRIRPDQLNKVSMEQAVRRTYEYDQEMAKRMREAAIKQTEGFPTYKEYPEGFRWIEIAPPKELPKGYSAILDDVTSSYKVVDENGKEAFPRKPNNLGHINVPFFKTADEAIADALQRDPRLEDALKYEGDTMGHCVGGYCKDVRDGNTKIYSLRDARGEPHVTVEVSPNHPQWSKVENAFGKEIASELFTEFKTINPNYGGQSTAKIANMFNQFLATKGLDPVDYGNNIIQIKGKGNAKPKDEYIPFVQDFVKTGNWSQVGDFRNTGLRLSEDAIGAEAMQALKAQGVEIPKYVTQEEAIKMSSEAMSKAGRLPPPEGMKAGGKVSISNNPDTMMLELGNKRMKEGGSEDDTKPFLGGAGTKKYAAAKKRAEQADVNTLIDPKTYAAVAGFFGERPDEMGFSVMHPDYQGVREAADPAFYAGTALGVAPLMKVFKAPAMALGRAGEKFAEKVVPQIMERGGVGADMLGGLAQGTRSYAHLPHTEKSPDPTVGTRYKRTDIGGLVPRKDLDIEKLDKSSVKVFPWDASDRNKLVTEVSDIPLTNPVLLEGGDNYMRDLKHVKKRIAGASNEGIANRIQSRIDNASVENQILGGTGKVFGFPIRMGDKAEHASTFPTDIAMDLLKQGNLSRKELDELTNELRGMAFENKGKGYFQNVAPVDSPEFLTQLREGLKADKEKGISGVTDMNLRRALMDRLSQKKYQKRLEYNYPDLINSVIADELKGIPKGYVGNVSAELDPFSKIRPSKSSTYSHDFGGKYFASMPDMPVEFLMPNTYEGIYLEMKALYPKAKPEALRNMTIGAMEKRKDKISEMIGPRSIDAVKSYQEGLKKGEFDPNNIKEVYDYMRRQKLKLKFAEGGEVSGDDLILEERPL
jgi:hypothetical protein